MVTSVSRSFTLSLAAASLTAALLSAGIAVPASAAGGPEPIAPTVPSASTAPVTTISGHRVTSPDGSFTVWVPNDWTATASDTLTFIDPVSKGLLTISSSTHHAMASVLGQTARPFPGTSVLGVRDARVYADYAPAQSAGGWSAVMAYVGQKDSKLDRGFAVGNGKSIGRVTFMKRLPGKGALPPAQGAAQVSSFEHSRTGQIVARILSSVTAKGTATPTSAGQRVTSPDGKISVWVPKTWRRQSSTNGEIIFTDPGTGGRLFLYSSTNYVMASPTTPVSTGVSVDDLVTVPGYATVVNGIVPPMGWGGLGLITSFVGEKTTLSNRGFALGHSGPVETVTFNLAWNAQTATPSPSQIKDQLTAFRYSQTGIDVDKIMHSVKLR